MSRMMHHPKTLNINITLDLIIALTQLISDIISPKVR